MGIAAYPTSRLMRPPIKTAPPQATRPCKNGRMQLSIFITNMKRLLTLIACMACSVPAAAQPAVSAGQYHNLGLTADGTVLWWGDDRARSQVSGQQLVSSLPQAVKSLPPAVAIAAGGKHGSAIARDGSVYEWGFSPYRMRQVLLLQPVLGPCVLMDVFTGGHGPNYCSGIQNARKRRMFVETPMRIPGLPPAVAIAAADERTAIVSRSGEVHCWHAKSFPTKVAGLEHIKAIALGKYHGVALREDGVVIGWGAPVSGISYEPKESSDPCTGPHPQPFFTEAIAIAAGEDSIYALRADGSVWAWGDPWGLDQAFPKEPNPDGKPDRFLARRIATIEGAIGLGGGAFPVVLTRQGTIFSWDIGARLGADVQPRPEVGKAGALASYSSVLALRADGFVCTMGDNWRGRTLPGDKSREIKRFVPLPLGEGQGPLNLVDSRLAPPPGLCTEQPQPR
jgi:alpha-tubulin suppressor-like RCC1 family protein